MNHNVIIIDPTVGSHHPFILQSDVCMYCTKWQKKGLTENQIETMIDAFQKWVYGSKPHHGTNARVASKSEHNDIVCATVLRDVYGHE